MYWGIWFLRGNVLPGNSVSRQIRKAKRHKEMSPVELYWTSRWLCWSTYHRVLADLQQKRRLTSTYEARRGRDKLFLRAVGNGPLRLVTAKTLDSSRGSQRLCSWRHGREGMPVLYVLTNIDLSVRSDFHLRRWAPLPGLIFTCARF